jgi:cytochrome c551/c552
MVKELCGLSSSRSKVIGPSVQDIASIYKAKRNIAFLVEDAAPIVDLSQYEWWKQIL